MSVCVLKQVIMRTHTRARAHTHTHNNIYSEKVEDNFVGIKYIRTARVTYYTHVYYVSREPRCTAHTQTLVEFKRKRPCVSVTLL